jgi:hypothetical protein
MTSPRVSRFRGPRADDERIADEVFAYAVVLMYADLKGQTPLNDPQVLVRVLPPMTPETLTDASRERHDVKQRLQEHRPAEGSCRIDEESNVSLFPPCTCGELFQGRRVRIASHHKFAGRAATPCMPRCGVNDVSHRNDAEAHKSSSEIIYLRWATCHPVHI